MDRKSTSTQGYSTPASPKFRVTEAQVNNAGSQRTSTLALVTCRETPPAPAGPFSGWDPCHLRAAPRQGGGSWKVFREPGPEAGVLEAKHHTSRVPLGSCRGGQLSQAAFLLPRTVPGTRATAPGTSGAPHSLWASATAPPPDHLGAGPSGQQLQESGRRGAMGSSMPTLALRQSLWLLPGCPTAQRGSGVFPGELLPQGLPQELVLSLGPH